MAKTTFKIALVAVGIAAVGTSLVLQHQAAGRLRAENLALEEQVADLRERAKRRPGAPIAKPADSPAPALQTEQVQELGRLRNEVGVLRQEPTDLGRLRAENRELKAATDEPEDPAEAEFKEQTVMRMNHLKQWALSFHMYASDHKDQFPAGFEQAASLYGAEALLGSDTNLFEITYRGTIKNIRDPGRTILFRETQVRQAPGGQWVKVYGFADGHAEAHAEPDEAGFAAWERDRLVPAQTNATGSSPQP